MRRFARALATLQEELRLATGCRLSWKDADPANWRRLPATVAQHGHPYCLAIKRDRERFERCCGCDNLTASDWPGKSEVSA